MNNIRNYKLFLEELVGKHHIQDMSKYTLDLSKSISDKLFFINKIDFDCIVDFGCADGKFLKELHKIKPDVKLIGYDLDDHMINKSISNLPKEALVTNSWAEVLRECQNYKTPILNLSSVIHEVYSYSNPRLIPHFWRDQVFSNVFKYITIRDMIPSIEMPKTEISKFEDDVRKVKSKLDKEIIESFEKKWGIIDDNYKTFTHLLLKYEYTDNWEREVNENYLPVSLETLKNKIPNNYNIIFEEDFILPYLKDKVKRDFDIDLIHSTHSKLILKRK